MTVFAVNLTSDDTTAAQQWGDIRHINLRYVYADEIENQQMPPAVVEALYAAALEFDPLRDYLLILGDHLQLVKFACELGRIHHKFRVLRWDKKAAGYIPVWV